ncbi:MAG: hypothetical protein JNM40_19255 [Myxococcales bacterium]|nr:hypothetical protein [Myxococcales bacterium]
MKTVAADCECLFGQAPPSRAPDVLLGDSLWTELTISCEAETTLRMTPRDPQPIAAILLLFAGEGSTDVWNSWLRAPRPPSPQSLSLLVDGKPVRVTTERWSLARHDLPIQQKCLYPATVIALTPSEPIAGMPALQLRIPPGPHQLGRIVLSTETVTRPDSQPVEHPAPSLPIAQPQLGTHGDELMQQLLQHIHPRTEPTLTDLAKLALPFRGGALLGHVEGPLAYQLWDGGLLFREWGVAGCDRTHYRIATDWLGELAQAEQRLRDGYLPVGELTLIGKNGNKLTQAAFVDDEGCLRARLRLFGLASLESLDEQLTQYGLQSSVNQARAKAQLGFALPTSLSDETLRSIQRTATRVISRRSDHIEIELQVPLGPHSPTRSFDVALQRLTIECNDYLRAATTLSIPDPLLDRLWKALLLHNRLFVRDGVMRYGLFPGVYDGGVFGVEEGWNIVALAQLGHSDEAATALRQTFFDPQFLAKSGQHHQYRNGLALTYAADVFALTNDRTLMESLWPQIVESADWICAQFRSTQVLIDGQKPIHYGLLPKHTYGGDLTDPAYSLYGSSTCWRGLRDAARLALHMNDPRGAAWQQDADEARRNLHRAAELSFRRDGKPPYLPFRTDDAGEAPSAGDYHQLFASLILETALFGWHGRFSHEITDYLELTGRQTLQVARFDQWFGRLGVDAEYSRGTQLCALHRRDFARFYLGLLGQVGLSCDLNTFVSPETAIVLFDQTDFRDRMRALVEQPARFDSDPCSAGTAVMLQYLRLLFVCEERDEDDLPTGTLLIGAPMPPSFFAPGQHFSADKLPTMLGTISLRCETTEQQVRYVLSVRQTSSRSASPSGTPFVDVELFYFDSEQKQRSHKQRLLATDEEHIIQLARHGSLRSPSAHTVSPEEVR